MASSGIMKSIVTCASFGVFLLLVVSCSRPGLNDRPPVDIANQQPIVRAVETGLTLDDVFGDHNPKMIGGWGGLKTHESWFLRCVRTHWNLDLMQLGLDYYYALNSRYPTSWTELSRAGFCPIIPLDPITGESINYDRPPRSDDDCASFNIEAGETQWLVHGIAIRFPTGEYYPYTWAWELPEDSWLEVADYRRGEYPNSVSMRGAMLSDILEAILQDYENRRALIPNTSEELLDGLWEVHDPWAMNSGLTDFSQPGSFVFGVDPEQQLSAAIWRDNLGSRKYMCWRWDPWPSGWTSVPQPGETDGMHGEPWGQEIEEGYVPPIMLWSCMLTNEG